ncbi:MAG: hypothetical protein HC898_04900 [Phycisphaerales bacterium]|nr:hypothetical protein [Phycisphaerales bacterium]
MAYEVIELVDEHTLTISQVRAHLNTPPIPLMPGSDLAVSVRSFGPQAALVHDMLLRMVGIEPDDPHCRLKEDAVVSMSVLARLEALGTLERVYSGAAAIQGGSGSILA